MTKLAKVKSILADVFYSLFVSKLMENILIVNVYKNYHIFKPGNKILYSVTTYTNTYSQNLSYSL